MKAALRYVLAGLEVWLGVLAILLGVYAILAMLGEDAQGSGSSLAALAAVAAIALGAGLVVDAIRREIGGRAPNSTQRYGSPLDSPTRPGPA